MRRTTALPRHAVADVSVPMEFAEFTDAELDDLRSTRKTIHNANARWVAKGGHREKNFNLVADRDPQERYRIFLRVSVTNGAVFSAGLVRVFASDQSLILVRYNGGYHPHRNIIERTKVPAVCHKHIATARYILAGYDADGYATSATGYNSVEGAFEVLCKECGVTWPASAEFQATFNFDDDPAGRPNDH